MRSPHPQARPRVRGSWIWWALVAVHALVAAYGVSADPLLCAVACSSLVLCLFSWFLSARKVLSSFWFVLVHIGGNTLLFAYMNYLYVNFTSLRPGLYHELSAWLSALSGCCTAAGALLAHLLLGREAVPASVPLVVKSRATMTVASGVFALLLIGTLLAGWLNARWDENAASENDFGATYVLGGVGPLWLVFFFVLGTHLRGSLLAPKNLALVAFLGVVAALQGLGGGRGASLFMVVLTLAGARWAQLDRRSIYTLAGVFALAGIVFSISVQEARAKRDFAYSAASDRVDMLGETAHHVTRDLLESDALGTAEPLIGRIFEVSGQDIIDHTIRTQHFAEFEHFDRLRYLFVPRFLAPDKPSLSDGVEVLERELGYRLVMTSVPITLIGDSFRRGGPVWVAVVAFCVGISLRVLPRIAIRVLGTELVGLFIAVFSMFLVGLHGESVLSAISALSYSFLKQLFFFVVLGGLIRFGNALLDQRDGHPRELAQPLRSRLVGDEQDLIAK